MVLSICCGKPHTDGVAEYLGNPFFPRRLGIGWLSEKAGEAFRGFATQLLEKHQQQLSEKNLDEDQSVIHNDVSPDE